MYVIIPTYTDLGDDAWVSNGKIKKNTVNIGINSKSGIRISCYGIPIFRSGFVYGIPVFLPVFFNGNFNGMNDIPHESIEMVLMSYFSRTGRRGGVCLWGGSRRI